MNTTMTQEPTVRPRVLVATDLGEWGDAAVREADRWARGMDADLTVLHCVPIHAPISPLLPQLAADLAGDLDELERRAGDAVVERVASLTGRSPDDFQVIVEAGTPHVEIVRTAEAEGASLVVVGARGSSGLMRALVGHSAEKVARFAHCAVLVVRPGASSGQILVATDLSAGADVAVRRAAALAEGRGATLTTMHVIDTSMPFPMDAGVSTSAMVSTQLMRQHAATELRAHLDALGVRSEVTIADGPVVDSMVRVARSLPAELVVVGTIGRTGLARVTLGNTAEAAIREVPCSVLVVRVDGATPR